MSVDPSNKKRKDKKKKKGKTLFCMFSLHILMKAGEYQTLLCFIYFSIYTFLTTVI